MCLFSPNFATAAADEFPDLIVRPADLYDYDIVTNVVPGHTHIRFSNGTANIGLGPLYLYGVFPSNGDGTQDVRQRIFRDDGSSWTRLAGKFIYHPSHQHIHFENWAQYRLREVLAGDSVGPVVATSQKTSFCILDLAVYDEGLPNFSPLGQFDQCNSTVQGISVGWIDVYSKDLSGQNIDVTGLPDGEYWLESEVDPGDAVLESDESNNISRVKVVIGAPAPINPDPYEPNDNATDLNSRPVGGINSPRLGPCNPERIISNLSMHENFKDDYFSFYMPASGQQGDKIRIDFQHALGDLDLKLLNASLTQVDRSDGVSDFEEISLEDVDPGWYYVRVVGFQGATNPSYSLTVNPSSNAAPSITVINPPVGNIDLLHGLDAYTVTWNSSDPENNERWVTVYADTIPVRDGDEIIIPTSLNTSATLGSAVINSAYLDMKTYWVYCEITDGGTTTGDWSVGTITFMETLACPRGDADNSTQLNIGDVVFLISYIFAGGNAPTELINGDSDSSGSINISDVTYLIEYMFANGPGPACP